MSDHDPTDIRSQERAKEDTATRNKLAKDTEASDVKWLMKCRQGRRIVWRLLDQAGVFRLSFNTNSMQMAFNEGNRNNGNRLLAIIHASCPELYTVMLKEATAIEERNGTDSTDD
jgi:organic hydroperoxide reductase OsmC/OhrA